MTAMTRHSAHKQERLPKRISIVRTKASLHRRRKVKKDQSTLTQIGWATPSFTSVDDGSEVSDPDFEEPRPKKKRKIEAKLTEEELKQATLTQIGWPFDENESDCTEDEYEDGSDDDEVEDEESSDVDEVIGPAADMNACDVLSRLLDKEHDMQGGTPIKSNHQQLDHSVSNPLQATSASGESTSSYPDPASSPSQRSSTGRRTTPRRAAPIMPSPELGRSPARSTTAASSPFKTPQKPLRREVPSSQSPATTPLSTVSASPSKRTPLRELSFEEWSQRDNTPTPKRRKPAADSEDVSDDKENAFLGSDDEEEDVSPSKSRSRKLLETSPIKDASKPAADILDTDALAMPPPVTRSLISFPPSADPTASEEQFMLADSVHHSSASERHTTVNYDPAAQSLQEDINDTVTQNIRQHQIIPSSQATTVDITQQSPRPPASQAIDSNDLRPSPTSPHHPRPHGLDPEAVTDSRKPAGILEDLLPQLPASPPPVFESQFPYSMFSHYSDDEMYKRYEYAEDSQERHLTTEDHSL